MDRIYAFLGLFSLVYFLESIGGSYIISAVQNIEKQFQIPSRMSGFMISAGDIGYIPTVLIIAYLGSKGNRARWIGGGAILMSLAYLLIASPNFIFPVKAPQANLSRIEKELHPTEFQLSDNASLAELLQYPLIRDRLRSSLREHLKELPQQRKLKDIPLIDAPDSHPNASFYSIDGWLLEEICEEAENVVKGESADRLIGALMQYVHNRPNSTKRDLFRIRRSATASFSYCGNIVNNIRRITREVRCREQGGNVGPFAVMFSALFFLGIGRTMPWSLGVPLLDDNVKRHNVPAYFAIISFIRILGPICGHLIGSAVNKVYYTLSVPTGLTANDPMWIGAWWMGFLIIGGILILPSISLFFFPSGKGKKNENGEPEKRTLELYDKHKEKSMNDGDIFQKANEFLASYKSILSQKVYVGSIIGRVCDILALKGYMVFMPKYLENHYGIPLYKVHQYMAVFGVTGFALGTLAGGFVTKKLHLNGRKAAILVLVISTINICFYFSKSFIACESIVNSVGTQNAATNYNFTRHCNADCGCDGAKLYPVCDQSGQTFYSPCHAGCREVRINNHDPQDIEFSSCECVESGIVRKDFCQDNCKIPTIVFFFTVFFGAFFGGCGVIPGMMILLRSVPPATRSMALALQGFLVSLFGTLPSPVLWGFVVDSACLVWEKACPNQAGTCSIYDPQKLRMRMHVLYSVIRLVSLFMDMYVWYHAKGLNIMDEEEEDKDEKTKEQEMEIELRKESIVLDQMPISNQ